MFKKKYKHFSGFTLLEMIVVIFILGMMATIGMENVFRFQKMALLDQTAGDIENSLKLARSRSITAESLDSEKTVDYFSEDGLPFYKLTVSGTDAVIYRVYKVKDAVEFTDEELEKISIDKNITITPGSTMFERRSGKAAGNKTYILTLEGVGTRNIKIDDQGKISIEYL